jgi:hypothetical protein
VFPAGCYQKVQESIMSHSYESDAHRTGRKKMAKITGTVRNFESDSDKAHRRYAKGGRAEDDEASDKKLFNKMFKEKGC